jgi:trypsin
MAFGLVICAILALTGGGLAAPHIRIVNGTDADNGEFPFVVSLRRSATGRHSCGGSILSPLWILTAAHCVGLPNPEDYEVQFGGIRISEDSKNVITVAEVRVHANYTPGNQFKNDIAVLRVSFFQCPEIEVR